MSQNNLTTSLLDKFQQKLESLNRTSQSTQQDNSKIMLDHVTSVQNESSNKEDENIMEEESLKKVDRESSENDNQSIEDDPAKANSESECSENRNIIPIASGYENLEDEESNSFYNELNEKSHEPSIDRDEKFKFEFMEKIRKDNFGEELGEGIMKEGSFEEVYPENMPNFKESFEKSANSKIKIYRQTEEGYSDGKQYGEDWRRNFVIDLLKSLSQLDHTKRNDYIKQASHQIKVRNYEIKIWLSSYQIIFTIEKKISQSASSKELLDSIERELFVHVKNNGNERRYIVTKMLGYIVKAFNLSNIKLDAWVKNFVTKYESEFVGLEILKKKEKSLDEEAHNGNIYNKPSIMLEKKKRKGEEKVNVTVKGKKSTHSLFFEKSKEEDISTYPISFREKVSNKVSEEIKKAVDEILTEKSEEFCLSFGIIKSIFKQHGDIDMQIKEKKSSSSNKMSKELETGKLKYAKNHMQASTAVPSKKMGESKKVFSEDDNEKRKATKTNNMNDSRVTEKPLSDEALLSKLEEKVSNFVKLNLNCPASALEKETESTMTSLNFNIKLKTKVRSQWLCLFLKKNNLTLDNNLCLRQVDSSRQSEKGEAKTSSPEKVQKEEEEEP